MASAAAPEGLAALRDSGDHEGALKLLARHAQAQPSSAGPACGEIVSYLLHLGVEDRNLVLRFTRWLLLREPGAAVDVFVRPRPAGVAAPPLSEALQVVLELPAAQQPPVLSDLLRRHTALDEPARGVLARQLVSLLVHELEGSADAPTPAEQQQLLRRLHALLGDEVGRMDSACAEATLELLLAAPARRAELSAPLTPHVALLLAHLGQHERALQLLAAEDPALALQYCETHYCDADAHDDVPRGARRDSPRVFDLLLAAYLQPPAGGEPQLPPVRGSAWPSPQCTCGSTCTSTRACACACSPQRCLGRAATSPRHVPPSSPQPTPAAAPPHLAGARAGEATRATPRRAARAAAATRRGAAAAAALQSRDAVSRRPAIPSW